MSPQKNYNRRSFIKTGMLSTAALGVSGIAYGSSAKEEETKQLPYKIGIRQASLCNPDVPGKNMIADFDTFKAGRGIPGITGIELQVMNGTPNMRDLDVARRYKAESQKWGLMVPSTAGVWSGEPWGPDAMQDLMTSIQATELVGARTMLVAFFGKSAPDMSDERAYGPVVETLKKVVPRAREAGIILGLENSLSPADNKKLIDLIDEPNVLVYYDLENMYDFGYGQQAVPGIKLLGKERLAAIHVKNKGQLISHRWRIDWAGAFQALSDIQYEGWLMFETTHEDYAHCIKETQENIAFIKKYFQPPVA